MSLRTLSIDFSRPLDFMTPPPWLHLLPRPVSHFLGRRKTPDRKPGLGNMLTAFWSCIGVFCGIAVLEAVFMCKHFTEKGAPMIIASFGATSILTFVSLASPLAQPRHQFLGHTISATLAIGITKLFALHPSFFPSSSDNAALYSQLAIRWLPGAVCCSVTAAAMVLTDTVHPPAGATALLAATDSQARELGWFLLPCVVLSVVLMMACGCIINNFQRRWPLYWWKDDIEHETEMKKEDQKDVENPQISRDESTPIASHLEVGKGNIGPREHVIVISGKLIVSDRIELEEEEMEVLTRLAERLVL